MNKKLSKLLDQLPEEDIDEPRPPRKRVEDMTPDELVEYHRKIRDRERKRREYFKKREDIQFWIEQDHISDMLKGTEWYKADLQVLPKYSCKKCGRNEFYVLEYFDMYKLKCLRCYLITTVQKPRAMWSQRWRTNPVYDVKVWREMRQKTLDEP